MKNILKKSLCMMMFLLLSVVCVNVSGLPVSGATSLRPYSVISSRARVRLVDRARVAQMYADYLRSTTHAQRVALLRHLRREVRLDHCINVSLLIRLETLKKYGLL